MFCGSGVFPKKIRLQPSQVQPAHITRRSDLLLEARLLAQRQPGLQILQLCQAHLGWGGIASQVPR